MEKSAGRYYIVVALLLIGGALAMVLRYVRVHPNQASDFTAIPMQLDGWAGREYALSDLTLDVLKASSTCSRLYTDTEGRYVSMFVAYFEDQRYGSQIHSPRHCLPGGGWGILALEPVELQLGDQRFRVNRVLIGSKDRRQVVYYWFRTRSGELTSEYGLKLDLVYNSLWFRPTDAALIRVSTEARADEEGSADGRLRDFLSVFHDLMEKSLPFQAS